MKKTQNTPNSSATASLLIPFLLIMAACAYPGNQVTRVENMPLGPTPQPLPFQAEAVPLPVVIEFPASIDPSANTAWQNHYRNHLVLEHKPAKNIEQGASEVLAKSTYFALELYEAILRQFPERTVLLNPTKITTIGAGGLTQVSEYTPPPARVVVHVSAYVAGHRVDGDGISPRDTYGRQLFPHIYFEVLNPLQQGAKRVPIGTLPRYSESESPYVRITEPSALSINRGRGQSVSGWFSPSQSSGTRPWQGSDRYFLLPMNISAPYESFDSWKDQTTDAQGPFDQYWRYVALTLQDLLAGLPPADVSMAANQYLQTLGLTSTQLTPELIHALNAMQGAEIQILADQDRQFMRNSYHGSWGTEFRHYLAMEAEAHKDETNAKRAVATAGFMNQIGTIAAAGVVGAASGGASSNQQVMMQMQQYHMREQQIMQMHRNTNQIGQMFQNHFSGVMRNQGDFIVKVGSEESEIRASSLEEMRQHFRNFLTSNFSHITAI